MAIQTNDPIYGASDREIAWAYGQMQWPTFIEIVTADQKRARLKEYARSEAGLLEVKNKILKSQSQLVEIGNFEWLQISNLKLIGWVKIHQLRQTYLNNLSSIGGMPPTIKLASKLSTTEYHQAFIYSIDIWDADLELKRNFLFDLKSKWDMQQKQDKKLQWINENDEKQIDWMWEYLEKRPYGSGLLTPQTSEFNSTNQKEKYISIFLWFYSWDKHPAELKEYQGKIKQAWTQLKYRANLNDKNKKQSTYALSNKTKNQLKALAEANQINLNQMLEYIIDEAYKDRKKKENLRTFQI